MSICIILSINWWSLLLCVECKIGCYLQLDLIWKSKMYLKEKHHFKSFIFCFQWTEKVIFTLFIIQLLKLKVFKFYKAFRYFTWIEFYSLCMNELRKLQYILNTSLIEIYFLKKSMATKNHIWFFSIIEIIYLKKKLFKWYIYLIY